MSESETKVNILIVDDRPDKLLALEAVLEDLGQTIVRAYSGREALRQVLQQEFAVILLDVNMPDMDGFETATLIRQRKSSEHIPIIFITAFGDDMHVARGYSLGAVDYILAPVVPAVLRSKVQVFVELFAKTQQVKRQAESLRRRAAQLQRLAAASCTINSALSLDKMLQTITDTARDVIGSHQAIAVFIDPRPGQPGSRAQAYTSYSDKYAEWRGQALQLDAVANTLAFRSHSATRLTEAELMNHPDWEIVKHIRIPPIRGGMLAAPLTGRDGTRLGVIYLTDRGDETGATTAPFTADDEVIAVQLAQMASIAIENSLFAEEREANRIKDEFLATLSHELRTPLNAILGWTQLLRMDKPTGDTARGLEVIERNVRAQSKLIEDLLDVSRISTGKFRLQMKSIVLGPIVLAAIDVIRPAADTRGIKLIVEIDPEPVPVYGDPDRLQQVVWNLLSNAVKFTPSGGEVRATVSRQHGTAQVRIADTGEGINPAFIPHAFDRFRQADSTPTRAHGGLGIGLTVVRHIVELHGGAVKAESAGEGMGAAFTVSLPVEKPAAREVDVPQPQAAPVPAVTHMSPHAGNGARSLSGLHVLLVDDDPDARDVLAEILSRSSAQVTTVGCARDARDVLVRMRPDVLVSDIAMPEEDGYALIKSVRTLPAEQGGQTPAIALTAYAREEDRMRALAAGFQGHLAKPVEPADFLAVVAAMAQREGVATH